MQDQATNDIQALLSVFPDHIREVLAEESDRLVEVVMDLGRRPKAYYGHNGPVLLSEQEITQADIDYVVSHISEFMGDNRAGIERTLHRISGIRNRKGDIIGLTCRVGRAVFGTINIIQNLLETGKSLLLLGRPGVGKTTLLREAARILSETQRVIVVDTSNEIAGDGDIPHSAIGKARRMQVPSPELQHHVMIEAVENHTPQVIIIDEIGRLEEAEAARTIAERGVQLIATAHGNTLNNLLVNPILADLVGGIDSVTLSDEEARRRGTQKSVLERRSPPTFEVLVEIQDHNTLAVHHNVARAVDDLLRGRAVVAEIRRRGQDGEIEVEMDARQQDRHGEQNGNNNGAGSRQQTRRPEPRRVKIQSNMVDNSMDEPVDDDVEDLPLIKPVRAYAYGANQSRLRQTARMLHVPLMLVDDLDEADVLITLKSHYRKRPQPISDAERNNIPLYILRSNTIPQMEACLADIFSLAPNQIDRYAIAMRETHEAIKKVMEGAKSVELSPQEAPVRRKQHAIARKSNLISHSYGEDPNRRVRIYRPRGM